MKQRPVESGSMQNPHQDDSGDTPSAGSDPSRGATLLRLLDYRRLSPRTQWIVVVLAVAFLIVTSWLSWASLGMSFSDLDLRAFALVLVTAPVPFLLSAAEYRIMARGLGTESSWRDSLDIALIGFTANLLPVPGGAMLRVSTLTGDSKTSPRRPVQVILMVGMLWLGVSCLGVALGLTMLDTSPTVWIWALAGLTVLAVPTLMAIRLHLEPSGAAFVAMSLGIEVGFVLTAAIRTLFAISVLGVDAPFASSLVIAASSAITATVGIVPAGLGVMEAVAAGLAGVSGLAPSVGLLAAVVLRVAGMVAAAIGSLLIRVGSNRSGETDSG